MKEFNKPEDYFPYIEHDLDHSKMQETFLWKSTVGDLFTNVSDQIENIKKNHLNELVIDNTNGSSIFNQVTIKGLKKQYEIAKDPGAAEVLIPRHRSLYDYIIGMPVHYNIINPEVMLLAGYNLLISKYASSLRKHGAVAFIRDDTLLKRKGYPKTFLTMKKYLNEVFPAYIKQEMITGIGENRLKRDLIIYPGQEKDPVTKIRSGGRTKSGKLRKLNPIFFQKFNGITDNNLSKFYITPVNISFSKYPDAPFIVHPGRHKGFLKDLRYLKEQNFIFSSYSSYCRKNKNANIDVIVNYGKPYLFSNMELKTVRDIIHFSKDLRADIGKLESIFPLILLYRAMNSESDLSLSELDKRTKSLFDHYRSIGINCNPVSDNKGNIKDIKELAEIAISTINANPEYPIKILNKIKFLRLKSGRLYSNDKLLQKWYENNIRHLDPKPD